MYICIVRRYTLSRHPGDTTVYCSIPIPLIDGSLLICSGIKTKQCGVSLSSYSCLYTYCKPTDKQVLTDALYTPTCFT